MYEEKYIKQEPIEEYAQDEIDAFQEYIDDKNFFYTEDEDTVYLISRIEIIEGYIKFYGIIDKQW